MTKDNDEYASGALDDMMGDGSLEDDFSKPEASNFTAENFQKFVRGEMTWGQLQGLTMEQAYAMAQLGYTQFEQGRYAEAQAIFEGLVVSNPYDAYFHTVLGSIYARTDRSTDAAEEYSLAIELDENNIAARTNRAELLLQHGEFQMAMDDLKQAIALDKDGTDPNAARARALATATAAIVEAILEKKKAQPSA